jgi:ribose transport system substrate-binding protein
MSQKAIHDSEHPHTPVYEPPPRLDAAISQMPMVEASRKPKTIGYLTNYSFHIWYQILIEVMKRRAAGYGVEVEIADANLSVEKQIEQARDLVSRVEVLVLTPAATSGLEEILSIGTAAGVPIVVEANPVEGMSTLVAICDYDAGFDLGTWVGNNVKNSNGSPLRILDVGLPWLRPCLLRSEGFIDGVRSVQPEAIVTASINGEATPSIARRIAFEALQEKGDVDVIFAMDDETAQGAYQGYLDAGFDAETVTVAGFGLSGEPEKAWLMRREALKVSQAMFPEFVALRCIDAAIKLFDGQSVPARDVVPTVSMTPELLDKYYPKLQGVWTPDFNVIASIPAKGDCTKV